MGVSRHNKPYRTISEPTVNQRVLGSSPRGGAFKLKSLSEMIGIFCIYELLGEKSVLSGARGIKSKSCGI